MPSVGNFLIQSIAGTPAAERVSPRPERRPTQQAQRRRAEDELITDASAVELDDPVRSLKSNEQEESHEDRQERPGYTPGGKLSGNDHAPRLDVAG